MKSIVVWDEAMEHEVGLVIADIAADAALAAVMQYRDRPTLDAIGITLPGTAYLERIRVAVGGRRVLASEQGRIEHWDTGQLTGTSVQIAAYDQVLTLSGPDFAGDDGALVDVLIVEREVQP